MSLTHERLREALDYNAETGQLFWCLNQDRDRAWNSRHAGKVAGYVDVKGYVYIRLSGRMYLAHRVVWFLVTGEWPPEEIDHIDGNPTNNMFDNLRLASHQQNGCNVKTPSHNTSGVKGVYAQRQKWVARIKMRGKMYHIGTFSTPEEAGVARQQAAPSFHGEFARI